MPAYAITSQQAQKIPIRNVWYLLLYAWDLGRWRDRWSSQVEAAPNLLGLLARILADSVQSLLRRQLGREFHTETAEIRGLRGKIHLSASVRDRSFASGRAVCSFATLGVDTLRNQILKSTLQRLLHDQRLELGATHEKVQAIRQEIWAALQHMQGVTLIRIQGSDFSRLRLGQNSRAYELPMAICGLIHRLELPTESEGDVVTQTLLREETVFWKLFENFARNFYRTHLRECSVRRERLSWFDELGNTLVPGMETDITLEREVEPRRRVVIDTKYYGSHLTPGVYGRETFLSGHLYQLYTYLRTQEDRGATYRDAAGVLLYPCVERPADEAMKVQGHVMWISTIDLATPWQQIEERLLLVANRALRDEASKK
jgi:5-methylcytosine-specific restriction enzyme subunit McrC